MEIRISEYAGPSSCYSEEWGKDERLLYDARDCLDKILRWPEAEK